MANVTIVLVFLLVFFAGIVVLQIFLSKKESKWPGLILPIITFMISILGVLSVASYGQYELVTEGGQIVESAVTGIPGAGMTVVMVLVFYNIPTAVLLAIYAACRGKRKRNDEIDKMNAQDL